MPNLKIIIFIIIIIAVIIGGFALVEYYAGRTGQKPITELAGPEPSRQEAPKQEVKVIARTGIIDSISENIIEMTALANRNHLLEEDMSIKVRTKETTNYIKIIIPKILLEDDSQAQRFEREEIKLSDLKIGDQITAISDNDIRGLAEFEAKTIQIAKIK